MQKYKEKLDFTHGILLKSKMRYIFEKNFDTAKNVQNVIARISQLMGESILHYSLFSSEYNKLYIEATSLMQEINTHSKSLISQYNKMSNEDRGKNLEQIENLLEMLENKYSGLVKLKTDIEEAYKLFKTVPVCEQDQNQKQK